LKSDFKRECT